MTLGVTFATPLLLIGLLAAAIPLVLHLLSSVRAQEVLFPTLRFLKSSMERTAGRRRIQHWLLLLLRALLLGLLALAVAEPISEASRGWLGGENYSAVVILDNSYSMQARSEGSSRFAQAKSEISSLLGGDHRPAAAALLTTNGTFQSRSLTSQLDPLRTELDKTRISYGRAPIAQRVQEAMSLMVGDLSTPQKSIYLFSDLQRVSFDELLQMQPPANAKDVHLFIINTAHRPGDNVGITDLEIGGHRVVDQALEFTATLLNSSPADKKVQVALRIEGQEVGQRVTIPLSAAGRQGNSTTARFYHVFSKPGPVAGDVVITTEDDLPQDNTRSFALEISNKVRALVVRGSSGPDAGPAMDGAVVLRLALDPYGGDNSKPWSIVTETLEADQFRPALRNAAIAFFCEVPSFTSEQAKAIVDFTAAGGTSVFFLGPATDAASYNKLLLDDLVRQGGLLPARIGAAVGEVGPGADAAHVDWVDIAHPYFAGTYPNMTDYLTVLAQRYYKLTKPDQTAKALMRLKGGEPLMLLKSFGSGSVVLCATTASPRWANLPVGGAGVFLPMLEKMSLAAIRQSREATAYPPDAQVAVTPGLSAEEATTHPTEIAMTLSAPQEDGKTVSLPVKAVYDPLLGFHAMFSQTALPGIYHWQVATSAEVKLAKPAGAFAINAVGSESNLESIPPKNLQAALARRGLEHVYVAPTVAEANAQALVAAQGHNWWDLLLAAVIVLLVAEAVVSNRQKDAPDTLPAHLRPQQN